MRVLTPFLDGVYYRLDLNGPDGKPANSKVLWTAAIIAGLVAILALGLRAIEKGVPITEAFVFFALGVIWAAGGHDITKSWRKILADQDTPPSPTPPTAEGGSA